MKKLVGAVLAVGLLAGGTLGARTVEGVDVPETVSVGGKSLALNGTGVRSVMLAFIPIKAYVAAFYAPDAVGSGEAVMASAGPLEFHFTFLRSANQGQVDGGWNKQFDHSVTDPYAGFAADQARFVGLFDPIGKGETQRVVLVGEETKVYDVGNYKGSVKGREFQKAFLSLFFGPMPASEELKSGLLAK